MRGKNIDKVAKKIDKFSNNEISIPLSLREVSGIPKMKSNHSKLKTVDLTTSLSLK